MTLPVNLPPKFRIAARDFADKLRANFASGMPAQPEDQLEGPVQALLGSVTRGVLTKTEAQVHGLGGRPDTSAARSAEKTSSRSGATPPGRSRTFPPAFPTCLPGR